MKPKIMFTAPALAAGAAAAVIAMAPPASAVPQQCENSATATVCQGPGSSDVVTNPPQTGGGQASAGTNGQNGEYGPSGDTPPVGN